MSVVVVFIAPSRMQLVEKSSIASLNYILQYIIAYTISWMDFRSSTSTVNEKNYMLIEISSPKVFASITFTYLTVVSLCIIVRGSRDMRADLY